MKVYATKSHVYGRDSKTDTRLFFDSRDAAIMHAGYLYWFLDDCDRSGYVIVREHEAPDGSIPHNFVRSAPAGLVEPGVETYRCEYVDQDEMYDITADDCSTETEANTIF